MCFAERRSEGALSVGYGRQRDGYRAGLGPAGNTVPPVLVAHPLELRRTTPLRFVYGAQKSQQSINRLSVALANRIMDGL